MSPAGDEPGLAGPGAAPSQADQIAGLHDVAADISTTGVVSVGTSVAGTLDSVGDRDWYAIELVAGEIYTFALDGGGDAPLADAYLYLYASDGTLIAVDDDSGPGRGSKLLHMATTSGTYYLAAASYDDAAAGDYVLSATIAVVPSPLESIDWGTAVFPVGGVIRVYFAQDGESYGGETSTGWSGYEIQQAMLALRQYSDVIPVSFQVTADAAAAQFRLVQNSGNAALGWFNPPATAAAGVGWFGDTGTGWSKTGLAQGGYGFVTLVHEFGHGLGLAHPHDSGGDSTVMWDVTAPFDSYGRADLNQGIYTTMSYNSGWPLGPDATSKVDAYGWQGTPMALDIAALQQDYGANTSFRSAADTYVLPTANQPGTFWSCIWDAGGLDAIVQNGTADAIIDLRAATLTYDAGGGGYVSRVAGVNGGWTIAYGVTIENAMGGSGNDSLVGNGAANSLDGGAGNDTISGGGGNDTLIGRGGNDTLDGGSGSDTVEVGYSWGKGYQISGEATAFTISGAEGTDTLANIEFVRFADGTIVDTSTLFDGSVAGAVSIGAVSVTEGDAGSKTALLIVTRTGGSAAFTIDYATEDGTALAARDYVAASGTISFGVGELSRTVSVSILGDTAVEEDETFSVVLSAATMGATVSASRGAVVIIDNDSYFTAGNDIVALSLAGRTWHALMGDDMVTGTDGMDVIYGDDGSDVLTGGGGDDTLVGGNGVDRFVVDAGADTISDLGRGGADVLQVASGATANVILAAGWSATGASSNAGVAVLQAAGFAVNLAAATGQAGWAVSNAGGTTAVSLTGSPRADLLIGGDGADTLAGGGGNDTLTGGGGADRFVVDAGMDAVADLGRGGADVLQVSTGAVAKVTVVADWAATSSSSNWGSASLQANGFAVNLALALGGAGWSVSNENETKSASLTGSARADTLTGGENDDTIIGGAGNDTLTGCGGNDALTGGGGNDLLTGGNGVDRFVVDVGIDAVTDLGLGGADVLQVSAGAVANVTVVADWRATSSSSNAGAATLRANNCAVNLADATGGAGWTVSNVGGAVAVALTGSARADFLTGGAGGDTLSGGDGADTLSGDSGDDTLTGGNGADRFVVASGTDTVADLGWGGADVLQVSAGAAAIAIMAANWTATAASSNAGGATLMANGYVVNLAQATGVAGWTISNAGVSAPVNLTGSSRPDLLTGGQGDDVLAGGAGNDTLIGEDGSDTLTGGVGNDTLTGGNGPDRFVVDAGTDTLADLGLGGSDVLQVFAGATAKVVLAADWIATSASMNAGTATLLASGYSVDLASATGGAGWSVSNAGGITAVALTGSAWTDVLTGGTANDTLAGGEGTDTLTGGGGNDTLSGGGGADRFVVDAGLDTVTDLGRGGADVLQVAAGATVNATLGANWTATAASSNAGAAALLANGFGVNLAATTGSAGWTVSNAGSPNAVSLVGSARADFLTGGDGIDALIGGIDNDTLTGGGGADRFVVDAGTDTIADLGLGADVLQISAGAVANATLAADWTASAATGNGGTASLVSGGFAVNLAAATGGAGWTVSNAGGATAVSLIGSARADILIGGTGDDTLGGGAGNDMVAGGDGTDRLMGGPGNDTLTGGASVDWFLVDAGTDSVADLGLGGADVVQVSAGAMVTASLAADWIATEASSNAGRATLLANGYVVDVARATGIAGWSVSNAGGTTAVALTGSARADTLTGGMADDTLAGGDGADTLMGGAGNDLLAGGGGADLFVVTAGTDIVLDLGLGGGDVLQVSAGAATNASLAASWTAPSSSSNAGVAVLQSNGFGVNLAASMGSAGWTVTNAGSDIAVMLIGSARSDFLVGGDGDDSLTGGAGNDILTGGMGSDTLIGGAGNDTLTGGDAADWFVVGAGTDTLTDLGLGGADILQVASGAVALVSLARDWSATSASSNAGLATLLANGCAVNLASASGMAGWTVSNAGSAAAVALTGSARADMLTGGIGDDTLSGGDGIDTLIGGVGNDTFAGGIGADRFVVDAGTDTVTDLGLGGADVLQVAVGAAVNASLAASWTATPATTNAGSAILFAHGFGVNLSSAAGPAGWAVSNADGAAPVTLTGSARADILTGGAGNDTLAGGAGDDTVAGGPGRDTMSGGLGSDVFVYSQEIEAGDLILDFTRDFDRMTFSATGFGGGLAAGMDLAAGSRFVSGAVPTQNWGQFLYSKADKTLYWDSDGVGVLAKQAVATFPYDPGLRATDLVVSI